jgi:hypothetical protein
MEWQFVSRIAGSREAAAPEAAHGFVCEANAKFA